MLHQHHQRQSVGGRQALSRGNGCAQTRSMILRRPGSSIGGSTLQQQAARVTAAAAAAPVKRQAVASSEVARASSGRDCTTSSVGVVTSSSSSSPAAAPATESRWQEGARAGAAFALALAAAAHAPAALAAAADSGGALAAAAAAIKIPGLVGDNQFVEGAVSGFLLIFFSEIGDKTFFLALLLALKRDRTAVFAGTFGALAAMTVISVGLGRAFHQLDELLPAAGVPWDDVLAVALLLFFGVTTLKGAADADARAAEEKDEAGEAVAALDAPATGALILSTFGLVFAAEWGDKSFLATIALAAASDPAGVVAGAVAGHALATGVAVAGGSLLGGRISERAAQYAGGSLFLVFAAATVYDIVTGAHG